MLRSQGKRTNTSITLAGRAADPLWPHPCDDDGRLAVAVALTGVIKQSLLERASDFGNRKVIDYSTAAGSREQQVPSSQTPVCA